MQGVTLQGQKPSLMSNSRLQLLTGKTVSQIRLPIFFPFIFLELSQFQWLKFKPFKIPRTKLDTCFFK